MHSKGLIQLRVIEATGAEQFAKYIYEKLNTFIQEETEGRVKVAKVEFMEHNKNTAIYQEN
jgi:6-pyruvoyltetrahydropterin/6-carboxytetrahydropterin synthase